MFELTVSDLYSVKYSEITNTNELIVHCVFTLLFKLYFECFLEKYSISFLALTYMHQFHTNYRQEHKRAYDIPLFILGYHTFLHKYKKVHNHMFVGPGKKLGEHQQRSLYGILYVGYLLALQTDGEQLFA